MWLSRDTAGPGRDGYVVWALTIPGLTLCYELGDGSWLRALTAVTEDPGLVPSTHTAVTPYNHLQLQTQGADSSTLAWHHMYRHTNIHAGRTLLIPIKSNKSNKENYPLPFVFTFCDYQV